MNKKKRRKFSLCIGLVAGVFADGYLRLISGNEGNLLIHTIVFLVSGTIAFGIVYGVFTLWNAILSKKNK